MKATLEFDLPEEENLFIAARDAERYWGALWDFRQTLMKVVKHNQDELSSEQMEIVENLLETFTKTLINYNVDLERLA